MAPAQIVQKTSEKRRNESVIQQEIDDGLNLFVDAPPDEDEDKFSISIKNDDSSDSESSVYSELENEDSGEDSSSEVAISESEDEDDDSSKKEIGELSVTEESITPISKALINEYEYDSSDEEDLRNTIGNIPVEWYNDYPHIGYDWDGTKIMKPATKDELDKFLNKMEDPNYWRTVHDKQTGKDVVLSDEDLEIIQKIQTGSYPSKEFNPFKPWVDLYSHEVEIHPMTNRPEHKRSFYPSKIEKQKVSKILHAIKMGWIQPKKQKEEPRFYPLWDDDNDKNEISKRMLHHIPAPKMKLPGHEESYNPPPEYLFTKEEEKEWLSREPEERKLDFIPKKYSRLLDVPSYPQFIKERFERCLDLYLCPRQQKMRMNVDPEDLIPKLPKPKDLQPFPTTLSIIYKGHEGLIRCLTVESLGQFLATGSDDNTIKVWEIATGRCLKTINVDGSVTSLTWCPNNNICLIAAAVNNDVLIINPEVGDKLIVSNTDEALTTPIEKDKAEKKPSIIQWNLAEDGKQHGGIRLILSHPKPLKQVTWHARGDYFASVMDDAGNTAVQIHQLTKRRTQQPFTRTKGLVQCVCFHPTKPYFFVATQRYVRIYNLLKQELTKKLMTNSKWVSSMAIHPAGDNIIIGGYDSRLSWFDLDLSSKPYQTLRHHKQAIRQVAFHRRYPLFASASDDCSVIVCHGMVYNDLLQNPLIVPVKVLKGHTKKDDLGVIDCIFHPNQPWIFSAGADGTARLYT